MSLNKTLVSVGCFFVLLLSLSSTYGIYTVTTHYKQTAVGVPESVASPITNFSSYFFQEGCYGVIVGAAGGSSNYDGQSPHGSAGGGEGAKVMYNYLKAETGMTLWNSLVLYDDNAVVNFYAGPPTNRAHIQTTLFAGQSVSSDTWYVGGAGGGLFNQDFSCGCNASMAGGTGGRVTGNSCTVTAPGAGAFTKVNYPDGGGWIQSNITYACGNGGNGGGQNIDSFYGTTTVCQPTTGLNINYGANCASTTNYGGGAGGAGSQYFVGGLSFNATGGSPSAVTAATYGGGGGGKSVPLASCGISGASTFQPGSKSFVAYILTDTADCWRIHMDSPM